MLLGDLLEAVEQVRGRITAFRSDLQKSEALTRYALIDPILRALGWETSDPAQVRPEFPTETGNPDYALLLNGAPLIMVEAKALGKSLDQAKDKGFQYCWKNKVSFYVITDGNVWEGHDMREMGGKVILHLAVEEGSSGEVARSLLALWRPAMPRVEAPPPSLVRGDDGRGGPAPPPPPPNGGAISLADLERKMSTGEIPRGSPPPLAVLFPDGVRKPTKSWRDLLLETVAWSASTLASRLPLTWPSTGRVVVSHDRVGMRAPKSVGPYWVEAHASALYLVKSARLALETVGTNPASVKVVLP